jgi:hypothetical protein
MKYPSEIPGLSKILDVHAMLVSLNGEGESRPKCTLLGSVEWRREGISLASESSCRDVAIDCPAELREGVAT